MKMFSFNTLLAGIGSTVALVVWGMIFWGWLHEVFGIFNKLPGDTEVVELLMANDTATGTYFFPWPRNTPLTMTASTSFWRKFSVIFLAGLMGTIFIPLSDPIWFHLPWPHTIGNAVFEIVSWLLMGAVIAAILKQGKANG
ncbi:MAG: hypothetical protein HYR94_16620 [Chloroflexi bacterium]|nr:hypothetical protein [Chloroflexota bacterium]